MALHRSQRLYPQSRVSHRESQRTASAAPYFPAICLPHTPAPWSHLPQVSSGSPLPARYGLNHSPRSISETHSPSRGSAKERRKTAGLQAEMDPHSEPQQQVQERLEPASVQRPPQRWSKQRPTRDTARSSSCPHSK